MDLPKIVNIQNVKLHKTFNKESILVQKWSYSGRVLALQEVGLNLIPASYMIPQVSPGIII